MLILVLGSIFIVLWTWVRRNRNKNDPPIFGSDRIGIRNPLRFAKKGKRAELWKVIKKISEETEKLGGVVKTTLGPRTVYMITDPEDFLKVSNACLEKDYIYHFARNWLGDGLITAPISKWKIYRKLLNPAFNQHVVDNFIDIFNSKSRRLVKNLEAEVGNGMFDHSVYIHRYALETICLTSLGVDIMNNSVTDNEYINSIKRLFQIYISRIQNFWFHNNFIYSFSSLIREEKKCIKILHNTSNTILKQVKDNYIKKYSNTDYNSEGAKFKPFMTLLLELSHDTNLFTDSELREQIDTVIAGGEDSSAVVIIYCMLLVGSYPRVQDKIYEEIKHIFGDDDRDITKQDCSQLIYLEAVIKESMRIYPIVPLIGRYLDKDIKLRNCTLSKGRTAFLSIYGIHRHSMWGSDVKEFRPERWLDSTIPDCPNALASFSMGRRTCIGKTYAMMSLKIALAHIFNNYIIHGDHTKMELELEVILKPVAGHYIRIERRY